MKKRLVGMMMAAAMTVSLLAGCSSGGRDTDQGDSDDIVTLKWYMSINPVYPDTEKVIEALNEYTGLPITFSLRQRMHSWIYRNCCLNMRLIHMILSRRSCGKRHPLMERFMGFPLIKKWDGSQVFLSTVTWQQNMALI